MRRRDFLKAILGATFAPLLPNLAPLSVDFPSDVATQAAMVGPVVERFRYKPGVVPRICYYPAHGAVKRNALVRIQDSVLLHVGPDTENAGNVLPCISLRDIEVLSGGKWL